MADDAPGPAEEDDELDSLLRGVARVPESPRGAGAVTFDSQGAPRLRGHRLTRGDSIDRYVLLDLAGAGGMGIVYVAYDPELDRKVALKLIRSDPADEEARARAQARLLREAQAMARLSHVNVVTVFDAGTVGEHVFLAMELVVGTTLREWLRAVRRPQRAILEVLTQAARGLCAAHAAGLVHRDFKPENVLIGADRSVRVSDFGLAHLAAGSVANAEHRGAGPAGAEATATALFAGTPAYMAPEQRSGEAADARTDQFAFCVTLYEALTGQRPAAAPPARGESSPARSRLPRWLRRLVWRGMAVAPEARFPSMGALLGALERGQRNARARRLIPLALLALGLAGGGLAAAWRTEETPCRQAVARLAGVWDDGRKAAVGAAFAATGSPLGAATFAGVEALLDAYAASWAAGHESACVATRVRGEQSEALLDLRMECLHQRRRELGALVEVYRQADAATVEKAADAAYRLTPVALCEDVEALRAPVPPPTDAGKRAQVHLLMQPLAQVKALSDAARFTEGLRLGAELATSASALGYRPVEAEALLRLGLLQTATDAWASAETSLQGALWAALAGRDDRLAARATIGLAAVLVVFTARHAEAWRWSHFAAALIERLGGHAELEARRLTVLASLRSAKALGGATPRAGEDTLSTRERVLTLTLAVQGPDHPQTAAAHHNLGGELLNLGRYAEAEREHRESLRITERAYGTGHPDAGWARTMLADVLRRSGRAQDALAEYRRALRCFEHSHTQTHHRTGVTLNNLADLLKELGRHAEAISYLQRARSLHEQVFGPGHSEVGIVRSNLAEVYLALGDETRARGEAEAAAALFRATLGGKHVYLGYPLTTLGRLALRRGDLAGAVASLEAALGVRRGQEHDRFELGVTRFALAQALWSAPRNAAHSLQLGRALQLGRTAQDDFAAAGQRGQASAKAVADWLRGKAAK